MKLLTDDKFALLTGQANAFIAIQTALVEASEDMTAEDITSETVIEALQAATGESGDAELQTQLTEAQTQLTTAQTALETANTRITELEAEVAELDGIPATEGAKIVAKGEAGGKPVSLSEFANKNKGDTQAILEQAKKEGLI